MTLVLEVEYLSGVSFAAISPDREVPDWPPQPDRIFSALVATWAARGKCKTEADALEWLEGLPVPGIRASAAQPRTSVIVFVPPNDPRSDKQKHASDVLPALRRRQPRRFPAAHPYDRVVRLVWPEGAPEEDTLSALQSLAHDTAYVGHSASLTRCRFLLDPDAPCLSEAGPPQRSVYRGRFTELRRAFDAGRRPSPGSRVTPAPLREPERTNLFGKRWLVLEHIAGEMPDIRACALVSKAIRDTLLSGYRRIGLGHDIPEIVSGHATGGAPTRAPHLAIAPLPFVGFPYADGHLMGFALIPPRASDILDNDDLRRALRELAPIDEARGRRILTLTTKQGTAPDRAFSVELSPTLEPSRRSLEPAPYLGPANLFATVTPIALDRHLKETGAARQDEIATQIAAACRNIGLPEPEDIVADKHSAVAGVPSAYPSGRSPSWMGWRLPPSLASRQLTHAVIRFSQPIDGPIILGAGRFLGLGLCRPLDLTGR